MYCIENDDLNYYFKKYINFWGEKNNIFKTIKNLIDSKLLRV